MELTVTTASVPSSWRDELIAIVKLAVPLILQSLFSSLSIIFGVVFIARLGVDSLAASVMATSIFNITGLSVVIGLSEGLETLCGQAFGAGNFRLVGLALQRATLILLLTAAAIIALWSQGERVMLLLGQEKAIAHSSSRYLLGISPGLLAAACAEALRRFLSAQSIATPVAAVSAAVCLLSPLVFWATTVWMKAGLAGAAWAYVACQFASLLLLTLITAVLLRRVPPGDPQRELWPGFSMAAFQGWGQYLTLAVPAAAMVCLEWWMFEVLIVLSGLLPAPEVSLAVVGSCIQVVGISYMVPLGISMASSTRISNALGAGDAKGAKRAAQCSLLVTLAFLALYLAAFIPCRKLIAHVFLPYAAHGSHESALLVDCLSIVAVVLCSDWVNCSMNGILRGAGRQELGAKINAFTWWGVGLGLVWVLAFKMAWGVRGLWAGITATSFLQACIMMVVLARLDWEQEALRAVDLVADSSQVAVLLDEPDAEPSSAKATSGLSEERAPQIAEGSNTTRPSSSEEQ